MLYLVPYGCLSRSFVKHLNVSHSLHLFSSQRRAVSVGLRVKVRFIKKATNPQTGKSYRKIKWYGGVICGTANGSRIIKIHYDDGTSEVANFPDKDIIVSDVNNGRHGGVGGGRGGAFAPDESSPISGPMALDEDEDDQVMMSSAEEEEEKEEAKRSGNTPEKNRRKRDSDDEENEFVFSPSTEKHDGRVDEEKEGSTTVLLSEVAASIHQSSINRGVGRDTGIETSMELMATSHDEYLGRGKMSVSDEMNDEGEEEEDGEIVESCPLPSSSSREEIVYRPSNEDVSPTNVPKCHASLTIEEGTLPKEEGDEVGHITKNFGEYGKDSDNTPLLISNDKPQDEGPSEACPDDRSGAMKCTNHQRLVTKQEGGGGAINSAEVEVHASVGIDIEGSEAKVTDETMGYVGFVGGVERTPPEDVPMKQATAADQSEQDTEKKKKKRGPLSIHIGLPGAKRKKLMDEGSKSAKPQDETPVATANDDDTAMDEVCIKNVIVGDNVEGKLSPTIYARLEVKSQSSGAQTDPTSLNTILVKGHDGHGDSLSDGEIQEDVLVRHHWISLREPLTITHLLIHTDLSTLFL
jgi:hypothetical protein